MSDPAANEPNIRIHIDRHPYFVHKHDLTGEELRHVPSPPIGSDFDLWQEERGDTEDQPVEPSKTIHVTEDMHFYSSPTNVNPGAC